jgi:hypothetical protein
MNLARLRTNFVAEAEGYDKVELALSIKQLAPLEATCCPLERGAMLQKAHVLLRFYQDLAPVLARTHGIEYSAELKQVYSVRLEHLGQV